MALRTVTTFGESDTLYRPLLEASFSQAESFTSRPTQRLRAERGAWCGAPCKTILPQSVDELIKSVAAEKWLVMDDHQWYATMTCPRHSFCIVDPALVYFLGVLTDVVDGRVVIEPFHPVHVLAHVIDLSAGRYLTSITFDLQLTSVLALELEVAERIVAEVNQFLQPMKPASLAKISREQA